MRLYVFAKLCFSELLYLIDYTMSRVTIKLVFRVTAYTVTEDKKIEILDFRRGIVLQSEFFITVNAITEYSTSDKNFVGTDFSLLKLLRYNGKHTYRHRQ